jgi:leader peptidase (prepilin peptidase)/N-methyltransferase
MIRILGTIFAGLLGLCFGSFLNVCLSRWPAGESVVHPRSHCRQCGRSLAWWENIPLLSWLALGGRCRTCKSWIGWRYPLVELAVAALWILAAWQTFNPSGIMDIPSERMPMLLIALLFQLFFYWSLVALAALDAEHLWLPNWLTWSGIVLGFILFNATVDLDESALKIGMGPLYAATSRLLAILAAFALILLIRWLYWLIRRREGLGLGDAKLMAMLAAWLGLPGALLAFGLGVILGALVAVVLLLIPAARSRSEKIALTKLPLGTFLCIGGIVSSLWGERLIAFYLRWAGF